MKGRPTRGWLAVGGLGGGPLGETELAINGALAFSGRRTGAAFRRLGVAIGEDLWAVHGILRSFGEGGKTEGIATSKGGWRLETADPRVKTATERRDPLPPSLLLPFQNWERACKRGAQQGTPLDPYGLAQFWLSQTGTGRDSASRGAFLHLIQHEEQVIRGSRHH